MAAEEEGRRRGETVQKSYFVVSGLCCSSEASLIDGILRPLAGVKHFSVVVPTRTLIVLHDPLLLPQPQILKALNRARLDATVRGEARGGQKEKWPSPLTVACGLQLLLSILQYVYHPLRWFAVGAVATGIFPIILKASASLRHLRLDSGVLVLVAVMGTIAMNDYAEAGTIVFLFSFAEWLESRASFKANKAMLSLIDVAPTKAVLALTGDEIDADLVTVNTVVAVKAGETIPIDGIVVDGKCEVDEKTLTGESFPVLKQKDDPVWAGSINLNGYIRFRTTSVADDCVVTKMVKLVEEAQSNKCKTERMIDKCAQYYTPVIVVISGSVAVVPLVLGAHDHDQWFRLALVILVGACPCALLLSTPVATFCALTNSAASGLLVKGGDVLETFSKLRVMAFDKTGTITKGEFVVTDFQTLQDDDHGCLASLLYWVSSIESKSNHPLASALVDYGRSASIDPKPENVFDFENFPGEGIFGKIDGQEIYIGNANIAYRAGSKMVPQVDDDDDKKKGCTIAYVFRGATPAAIFYLSDKCRIGVNDAIKELKCMGIRTAMLTGDCHSAAMHTHNQLGRVLDVVYADLRPEGKETIVRKFMKEEGVTAMIGDGMNDAPALAVAHIGISMGISGSSSLAMKTAQMILLSNDVRGVPRAVRLARGARRKVVQNVVLSVSAKAAVISLAVAWPRHPLVWAAVLADVGACLLVIFNSMLLLHHESHTRCCRESAASYV